MPVATQEDLWAGEGRGGVETVLQLVGGQHPEFWVVRDHDAVAGAAEAIHAAGRRHRRGVNAAERPEASLPEMQPASRRESEGAAEQRRAA